MLAVIFEVEIAENQSDRYFDTAATFIYRILSNNALF